jgi:hypothetical protein
MLIRKEKQLREKKMGNGEQNKSQNTKKVKGESRRTG